MHLRELFSTKGEAVILARSEHLAFQGVSFTRSGHSDRPCGFSFRPQEPVTLVEWLPETLDSHN